MNQQITDSVTECEYMLPVIEGLNFVLIEPPVNVIKMCLNLAHDIFLSQMETFETERANKFKTTKIRTTLRSNRVVQ